MKLQTLGYTTNWIDFGLLDTAKVNDQYQALQNSDDEDPAQFRLITFMTWLDAKKEISDTELQNILILAREDEDQNIGGSILRILFVSPIITEKQFNVLKAKLPAYGAWTEKLIIREVLSRKIDQEEVTQQLLEDSLAYKRNFDDNRLLIKLIAKTEDIELLKSFENNGSGKRLRTIAEKRINQINRKSKKD